MTITQIYQDISSLPPEAQKQVSDYVAFLKSRYPAAPRKKIRRRKLANEPFVGMWKNRAEFKDGAKWVREFRRREWNRS